MTGTYACVPCGGGKGPSCVSFTDVGLSYWVAGCAWLARQGIQPMLPPACLMEELPPSEELATEISQWRSQIADVMQGNDDRLLCIVGPCSVHDASTCRPLRI